MKHMTISILHQPDNGRYSSLRYVALSEKRHLLHGSSLVSAKDCDPHLTYFKLTDACKLPELHPDRLSREAAYIRVEVKG